LIVIILISSIFFKPVLNMPEHQNIEYKESWRDEYLKWICGFANAHGGKIFIGIDDKEKVTGLTDYRKLMEEIPNKIVNHLGLVVDVNLHTKTKKHYIEIAVNPSDVPISYHGNYHYRSGSTKQELKGPALYQFLLKKLGKSWDDMPHKTATLYDLNDNTINKFLNLATENKRLPNEAIQGTHDDLFSGLHLMNEEKNFKNAALLLFGSDPLKYFSHAYFKIGRFGIADADLKFQDIVESNLLDMPDRIMDILRSKYLTSPVKFAGLQRVEKLEYPEEALREAIINAIVHKDYTGTVIQLKVYDDKLIIWNPGTLPGDLSIEQLKKRHSSHPRNRNIADVFFKAGYIEAWGSGINRMIEACRKAGLPEPDIKETEGGIEVIFLKDIFTEDFLTKQDLSPRQIKAVLFVKEFGSITNAKYQEINKVSKPTATRDLQELSIKQILENKGKKGAGSVYVLVGS
ncbi:MAG TPA: ATP-binding protein, partial [Chitinophagaceae bacterium]|nr:ATP-binding protein [Chitinophagaceae bacterium]